MSARASARSTRDSAQNTRVSAQNTRDSAKGINCGPKNYWPPTQQLILCLQTDF